ncbi:MAG: amino acid adenylation domain-containing protein, partial [Acidobacteriota bacterium]
MAADSRGEDEPEVRLLDGEQRQLVLEEWNRTSVVAASDDAIHEVFARQAERSPRAIAVSGEGATLTYEELHVRSNRLAHSLRARGVSNGSLVGVCLDRTPETVVALLAILKAGAGYLPLDPALPLPRLAFMIDDAAVALVVTQARLRGALPIPDRLAFVLDNEHAFTTRQSRSMPAVGVDGGALAYVNYTSGSTGTPKGVEIVHRAVVRLVCAVNYVTLNADERVLHAAPLSFDASTFEIWGPLLNGGRLVLYPEEFITPAGLARTISAHRVTTLWLTGALFNAIVDQDVTCLRGIRQLLAGGEALSVRHVRRAMEALPDVTVINGYGPTESTTFTTCYTVPRPLAADARAIPIGRPIRDTRVYVLDDRQRPVAIGVIGELYIGGAGLARGYLNQPELTAENFTSVDIDGRVERLYRSGDLVRFLPDGALDFIGRADNLVKIRGFRIELGEIETALAAHAQVRRALVVAGDDASGGKRLVAYVVAHESVKVPTATALREYLEGQLPAYMVPSVFMWLADLPISTNGKIDYRALPPPGTQRPDLAAPLIEPDTVVERLLCRLFGEALSIDRIGVKDGFFELGGNSLLCLRLLARLEAEHGLVIPAVEFFRTPDPEQLAAYLARGPRALATGDTSGAPRGPVRAADSAPADDVAVIGMAGRFPGADTVEEMWRNICAGTESITYWSDAELDASVPAHLRGHADYVRGRGVLRDVEMFDAEFFGIHPREAEVMDPQQRIFLEIAWEALEHSGHVPDKYRGQIGVFGGMYDSSYFTHHVAGRIDVLERVGAFQAMVAHEKDYLTTRVAHRLGLTGPTLNIQTACSTSLVAISEAFFSLRARRCDMALAGGVAVTCPPRSGYLYQEGAMLSPDGHTRPFDADARGTVFSDGAAIVVLKRLHDAVADGDTIYAVLRGAAVNNDGASRPSFSAPSVDGQAAVVAMAHACAGVHPRSVSYVEAHGTATPLGDPVEVEALTRAFQLGTRDTGFCGLGSIKSNLGHLVIAAGATGLVKTVLALSREEIPPTINFRAPNPRIDFAGGPFYVNATRKEWKRGRTPRLAGVSSFGVGGTNAHVVLEEAPEPAAPLPARAAELLVISARTASALDAAAARLGSYLGSNPAANLSDVANTLQAGRRDFPHRRILVATDAAAAAAGLKDQGERRATAHLQSRAPRLAMMFPGQGSQYPEMGRGLYRADPTFRSEVEHCAARLRPYVDFDLLETFYPASDGARARPADATAFAQPAIFVLEYALAKTLMHWGVQPDALIGHSVGEFVCGALAGVFSLADALRLVAARGRMMQARAAGAMLSVRLAPDVLAARLGPELAVASANGASLSVASGPVDAIAALQRQLGDEDISCKLLNTSHAFHSPMMDGIVEPFAALLSGTTLNAPAIPILSTVTGQWLTAEEATDPIYWARHLRATVRFGDGLQALRGHAGLLVEVGPGSTLTTLSKAHPAGGSGRVAAIATLPGRGATEWQSLLDAVGQMWLAGVPIDWTHHHGELRRRVALPTYPFEKRRYWIDACPAKSAQPVMEPVMSQSHALPAEPRIALVPAPASVGPGPVSTSPRTSRLMKTLRDLLETSVGIEVGDADQSAHFVEIGLDSLTLTQTARLLHKTFGVNVTFRQLMEDYPTLQSLAQFIDAQFIDPAVAEVAN